MFAFRVDPAVGGGVGLVFTDRRGGLSRLPYATLNLGNSSSDDPARVSGNLERLRRRLGLSRLVGLRQVHGTTVVVLTPPLPSGGDPRAAPAVSGLPPANAVLTPGPEAGSDPVGGPEAGSGRAETPRLPLPTLLAGPVGIHPAVATADAIMTAVVGVGLLVRVADCVPVILADPAAGLVAVAHAGRKGLLDGVLEATVAVLRSQGATRLTAWIGPHICGRCYEVPPPMAQSAWDVLPVTRALTSWGTAAIDLGAGAAAILAGLDCAVERVDPCTAESPGLFSYRRDGRPSGRLGGVVWLAA